jgi:HEPN domain-containing protein
MADTRREFQQLARMRLRDARVLLQAKNAEGAYYLTGLAVECALKACIAKNTKRYDFPPNQKAIGDIYTHDLAKLVRAAGLQMVLESETNRNGPFSDNWGVLKTWTIESRYRTKGLNAHDLYRAVAGKNWIIRWLRQRW